MPAPGRSERGLRVSGGVPVATPSIHLEKTMSDTVNLQDLPTSFGAFKPVGHLMLGVPRGRTVDAVITALKPMGLTDDELVPFTPQESEDEMGALLDNASPLADFGYETKLMARYVELSRQGHRWLLVHCESDETARRLAEAARGAGADLAVHYRRLVVEEIY